MIPTDLKGRQIEHGGKTLIAKEIFTIDGQIVFKGEDDQIKIDKSFWPEFKARHNARPGKAPQKLKSGGPNLAGVHDEPADYYYKTRNYDQFQYNDQNRVVNPAHVKALKKSIQKNNLLFAQPILVNLGYEVIDGQHRLQAARELKKEIFYIIKEGLSIRDAIALNIDSKNWTYKDYLDHWISQGRAEYKYFESFMDKYRIPYSMSAGLLMKGMAVSGGGSFSKMFKNGELTLDHQEFAESIGELVIQLGKHGDFTNERSFVTAIIESLNYSGIDPSEIIEKVNKAPDKFHKCSDTKSYIRMLEDVCNYNRQIKIRFY